MSDPINFYRLFINNINTFIAALEQLNLMQDRMAQDSGLAAAAAAAAQASGRSDLTAADFTNAGGAIAQIDFAYTSGAPPQKSFLYKVL